MALVREKPAGPQPPMPNQRARKQQLRRQGIDAISGQNSPRSKHLEADELRLMRCSRTPRTLYEGSPWHSHGID